MDRIKVLVTGVGGGGVGEQIVKALRMSTISYKIFGTDITSMSKGLYEVEQGYVVPPAGHPEYISILLRICLKENISVVIPGSEPELYKISEYRKELEGHSILPIINTLQVLEICADKFATCNFLVNNNFDCPESILCSESTRVRSIAINKQMAFPLIIKPAVTSCGSSNVFIAQDEEELVFFVSYLLKQKLIPLVQTYVGSFEEEYTVGTLTDMLSGNLIGSIALKRQIMSGLSNRVKITSNFCGNLQSDALAVSSGISQGIIEDFPEVRSKCEEIALKLGSKGPLNIQCRKVGEKIYPFEINARFSGTTSLRAQTGYNEPDIMIRRHLLGETIPTPKYKTGVILRGLSELYISPEKILP